MACATNYGDVTGNLASIHRIGNAHVIRKSRRLGRCCWKQRRKRRKRRGQGNPRRRRNRQKTLSRCQRWKRRKRRDWCPGGRRGYGWGNGRLSARFFFLSPAAQTARCPHKRHYHQRQHEPGQHGTLIQHLDDLSSRRRKTFTRQLLAIYSNY